MVDPDGILRSFSGVTFPLACDGDRSTLEKARIHLSDRQSGGASAAERDGDRVTIRDAMPGRLQLTL